MKISSENFCLWWMLFQTGVKGRTGPVERVKPDCKYQGHDDDLLDLDIVHLCPLLPGAGGIGKQSGTLDLYRQGDVVLLFPVIKEKACDITNWETYLLQYMCLLFKCLNCQRNKMFPHAENICCTYMLEKS